MPGLSRQFAFGYEQMDRQEEQIAHELETILPADLHKTAAQRRFMPNLPIRHPQEGGRAAIRFRCLRAWSHVPRVGCFAPVRCDAESAGHVRLREPRRSCRTHRRKPELRLPAADTVGGAILAIVGRKFLGPIFRALTICKRRQRRAQRSASPLFAANQKQTKATRMDVNDPQRTRA